MGWAKEGRYSIRDAAPKILYLMAGDEVSLARDLDQSDSWINGIDQTQFFVKLAFTIA